MYVYYAWIYCASSLFATVTLICCNSPEDRLRTTMTGKVEVGDISGSAWLISIIKSPINDNFIYQLSLIIHHPRDPQVISDTQSRCYHHLSTFLNGLRRIRISSNHLSVCHPHPILPDHLSRDLRLQSHTINSPSSPFYFPRSKCGILNKFALCWETEQPLMTRKQMPLLRWQFHYNDSRRSQYPSRFPYKYNRRMVLSI